MKLWKKPRLAAALCAVVVLVCAAAPAVFLSVVDAASLGHSQAVADPYTAPTPTADDYYLLRQLSARQLTQSKYTFQPGDTGQERKPLIYYNNQANDLTDMTNGWDYVDTVNTALQSLADVGAISQAWADYAADWYSTEETTLTTYDERQYSLTVPYYSVDSLGLVTFKRFAVQNGVPTTLMTLKMDSRTGQVYSFWLSTPADSAAAHDPESLPKEAALRAFADQAGLTSLGDWARREDLTYPRAIYSLNGQALVAAASGTYTVNDYFTYSGATSDRWYVSIELSLCAEANLPLRMQDDTTNLEKEANPDA